MRALHFPGRLSADRAGRAGRLLLRFLGAAVARVDDGIDALSPVARGAFVFLRLACMLAVAGALVAGVGVGAVWLVMRVLR